MNINEAMKACQIDAKYETCEKCGVYGNSECWIYLSKFLLDECSSCGETTYYYVNDCNEIEKIEPNFCPECGRAL